MRSHLVPITFAALLALSGASPAQAIDWLTAPGAYTHNPYTGERVSQFSPGRAALAPQQADFQKSGFRHTRSSLRAGDSADYLHLTERWGRPVRPYGEWQRPFRPYSVPYHLWGPPSPLVDVDVYTRRRGSQPPLLHPRHDLPDETVAPYTQP